MAGAVEGKSEVIMKRRHAYRWVCEFCFRIYKGTVLPGEWDLVWQSAVALALEKQTEDAAC